MAEKILVEKKHIEEVKTEIKSASDMIADGLKSLEGINEKLKDSWDGSAAENFSIKLAENIKNVKNALEEIENTASGLGNYTDSMQTADTEAAKIWKK